jgi:hypothetical protein
MSDKTLYLIVGIVLGAVGVLALIFVTISLLPN